MRRDTKLASRALLVMMRSNPPLQWLVAGHSGTPVRGRAGVEANAALSAQGGREASQRRWQRENESPVECVVALEAAAAAVAAMKNQECGGGQSEMAVRGRTTLT